MFTFNEITTYGIAKYLVATRGKVCLRIFYTTLDSPDFGLLLQAKVQNNFHKAILYVTTPVDYIDYYGEEIKQLQGKVVPIKSFDYMTPFIVGKTVRSKLKVEQLLRDFNLAVKPKELTNGVCWDTGTLTYQQGSCKYIPQLTKDLKFELHQDRYLVSEYKNKIYILPTPLLRHVAAELLERVVLDLRTGLFTVRYSNIYNNMYITGCYSWDNNRRCYVTQEYKEVDITGYKEA